MKQQALAGFEKHDKGRSRAWSSSRYIRRLEPRAADRQYRWIAWLCVYFLEQCSTCRPLQWRRAVRLGRDARFYGD